ncbi:lipase family protein [Helicobacter sp. MIT 14-3879]|uniref:lipase family protein n=1 Tax=Helicobacter sp. MIT 14-3879 TaxID=2040649 RepID=UPI000E1F370F|nr:Mbeg1-like protein [Helicobacter sp. MIT 14-3879]RDU59413.1 hypothetical protein CQA44_11465 [Helicobacter sp. MIT 14-3879]
MTNKECIKKLRDNAELAQASYFYFDLLKDSNDTPRKIYELDSNNNKIKDENYPRGYKEIPINLEHIISKEYQGQEVLINLKQDNTWQSNLLNTLNEKSNLDKLNGEFGELQTKEFLKKYDLLDYYPKDNSRGFHACLFQDKESKAYTFAIRGSFDSKDYVEADFINLLMQSSVPRDYFEKMLNFYKSCAKKYPAITQPKSLNVVGHSLGGCLAQLFALSFATDKESSIIKEVYTFNSPGAKELKPSYDILFSFPKIINNEIKESLFNTYKNTIEEKAKELHINYFNLYQSIESTFKKIIDNHISDTPAYFGIRLTTKRTKELDYTYVNYEKLPTYLFQSYQTLLHNYNNRNAKDKTTNKPYTLKIKDNTHHIETDSNNITNDNENNLIQNLGEDIEGKHYYINIGVEIDGFDRHSIKSSSILLSFYDYLLDLKVNRELLANNIQTLQDNKDKKEYKERYENCIGYKASKNKEKYQLLTALINDFMEWTYNSLRKVETIILQEEQNKYRQNIKFNKNITKKSPEKVFPLAYLLSEVSYIAKNKDSENIKKFDLYKMIDTIIQLQTAEIYIRILDKKYFDDLENKKECSVADMRAMLKCQPFMVVDKDNKEILNKHNITDLFLHKDFTRIALGILNSYESQAV